jgi:hypothetical protein
VGAPYHYEALSSSANADQSTVGGVVYVYFSTGRQKPGTPSSSVFTAPLILRGPAHSQFGAAITKAGDLNKDGFEGLSSCA